MKKLYIEIKKELQDLQIKSVGGEIMYKVYVTLETININTLEKEYKSIIIDTFDTLEEASNFIEDKQGYTIVY